MSFSYGIIRGKYTRTAILLLIALLYTEGLFGKSNQLSNPDSLNVAPVSVGLVLSGGGAKGIAEIGVIQALEDNDIPIDYITGTSMGAIVGGLYAAGYTPDEMMNLILSPGFASWSTGKIDPSMRYYFGQEEPRPEILKVNLLSKKDSTQSILPSSLISPLPMNFAFMELFAAYTAQCGGDFNNLFVPYRCVTSDVYAKHKVVLSKGDFGDAIRSSMSFPTVFQPIEIDGFLAFDGGIYDNFPVDVMREDFAPGIIIGVDVSGPDGKTPQYDLLQQLEDLIIQKNDYNLPADEGIRIKINTEGINLLDFPEAKMIYKRGYDKAMEMMDSIKGRVVSRISKEARTLRRNVFKSQTPYIRFDSVNVTGGTPAQNKYLEYLFTEAKPDTFGLSQAKLAYYRAVTSGKLRNLVPHAVYNDTTGLFALDMKAVVKDSYSVGLGGYLTSSVNSMIFLSGSYNSLAFNSLSASLNGWLGQSYMAASVKGRVFLSTHIPSALTFQAVISRERLHQGEKLFYEDREPVFITKTEAFGRIGYSWAAGRNGAMEFNAGYGYNKSRFSSTGMSLTVNDQHDNLIYKLGQLRLGADFYTLNNQMYPTEGYYYHGSAMALLGNYDFRPDRTTSDISKKKDCKWLQLELDATKYWSAGAKFSIGLEGHVLASTRKILDGYNETLVAAPAYNPTPSSYNSFHSSLRAMSYVAAGITPVWKFNQNLQLRATAHCFVPFRAIESTPDRRAINGKWFHNPKLFAEAALAYNFPFASLAGYVNYIDSPGDHWNVGLSFGLFFLAPSFLH